MYICVLDYEKGIECNTHRVTPTVKVKSLFETVHPFYVPFYFHLNEVNVL